MRSSASLFRQHLCQGRSVLAVSAVQSRPCQAPVLAMAALGVAAVFAMAALGVATVFAMPVFAMAVYAVSAMVFAMPVFAASS